MKLRSGTDVFSARRHSKKYRPPKYIENRLNANNDDADLRSDQIRFFFGVTAAGTRVTFEYRGEWYFVDRNKSAGNDLFKFLSELNHAPKFSLD